MKRFFLAALGRLIFAVIFAAVCYACAENQSQSAYQSQSDTGVSDRKDRASQRAETSKDRDLQKGVEAGFAR